MNGRMSVKQYRIVDLFLWAVMLCLFESVTVLAATRWFPGEPYTVSVVPAIVAIVLIRWGPWAAVHAALGGAVFCLLSHGSARQLFVYAGGNLLALLALLPLKRLGDERIRSSVWLSLAWGLAVLLLMQLGRALIALCLGAAPAEAPGFFTTEAVTMLFTLVILWIVRRLDGVLEDQHHYLSRVRKETEGGGVR